MVLGGTGFLGSHVVERLAKRDPQITIVSRSGEWPWGDLPNGVGHRSVDITSHDAERQLGEVLEHASIVVNLTGILARPSLRRDAYTRLHVDGTHRIVDALARAKAPRSRLIHVSTTGVLGPTTTTPRDEEAIPAPSTVYEWTKLEGETIALAARRPNREVVIVRPGMVYGPRDLHRFPWFHAIERGTYRPISGGRAIWQPIFVDDLARGIEAALDVEAADGQTFHLAGSERLTIAELYARIARILGRPARTGSLPRPLAMAAGALFEAAYKPFRRDPPLSRARVRTMTENRVYAIDRAESLLGFRPELSLDQGLVTTIDWYRMRGLLP
ncbi:MAG TPA: NAD-dependent epimerase/dehydratase family protein [Candidatus Polarisedimenticolaceae bacterium]|nr:NAD-dependent epimerase/dehydratase family protein [Candidatus Polarisedimenticolaceae bacterium]